MYVIQVLMLVVTSLGASAEDGFSYEGNGPSLWPGICQTGKRQSPINFLYSSDTIVRNRSSRVQSDIVVVNGQYSKTQSFSLRNTGHTVRASLRDDLTSTCTIRGPLLPHTYVFSQLHFHWGSSGGNGSEHTIEQTRYAMEGHLVHYSSQYDNLTAAVNSNKSDALAVFGVLYKASNQDNPRLKPIIDLIPSLKKTNGSVKGTNLNLRDLLPFSYDYFGQYEGSLTTPDCNQVVFWNVVLSVDSVSNKQLDALRSVINDHGVKMENNYRPLQPENKRYVQYVEMDIYDDRKR